jgi:hypothetical protein
MDSFSVTGPVANRIWILSPSINSTLPVPHSGFARWRTKSSSLSVRPPDQQGFKATP